MTNYTEKQRDLLDAVALLWNYDLIDTKTFKRLNSEIIRKVVIIFIPC